MREQGTAMKTSRDPVCGMSVAEGPRYQCRYRETEYGFCSEHCLVQFSRHPDYYLGGKPQGSVHARDISAAYTCPMHPEVRQEGPGDCPKCGMALEPEGVAVEEEAAENPELARMSRRFWACLAGTAPVFVLAMTTHLGFLPAGFAPRLEQAIEFALATPVVWWPFSLRNSSVASRKSSLSSMTKMFSGRAGIMSLIVAGGRLPTQTNPNGT